MKGAHFPASVYKYLLSPPVWWKKHPPLPLWKDLVSEVQHSPYEYFIVPLELLKEASGETAAPGKTPIPLLTKKDLALPLPSLPYLFLATCPEEVQRAANLENQPTEIIFHVRQILSPKMFEKMMSVQNLRWLFSPEIPLEQLHNLLDSMNAERLLPSDYIELSTEKSVDLWFSPKVTLLHQQHQELSPAYSVIVPFQDNWNELKICLASLLESLGSNKNVELILADDSFSTAHREEVVEFTKSFQISITYIIIERPQIRQRGDSSFRAGVVRNLGAKWSRGSELIFLDSDILVGPDFWDCLQRARQKTQNPLMPRRHFLRDQQELSAKTYRDFSIGKDTLLSWGGHWEDFYRDPKVQDAWKWTSTYCLCLPKEVFFRVGGFRRCFSSYGFEDTELGYRLNKEGYSLEILDQDVLHLPTTQERSEYSADFQKRKTLLAKSFSSFVRVTLDRGLFDIFGSTIN